MTGRRPERAGRSGGLELIPSVADETERIARELIAASPGLTAAQKQIEQDHLTRHLALGGAGQRTLDGYAISLGPLRALGRNGDFGAAWDGDTLPIPAPTVLAYLYARAGEITHVTAERIVQAVLWVHRNGRWPDAEPDVAALDTTGWENPAAHPAIKNHLAARTDGENRPDRTQCLALILANRDRRGQQCRADSQVGQRPMRSGSDRCGHSTTNPDGLCRQHRAADPVHPAQPVGELRRCQHFTVRGGSLCVQHVEHERCRAELAGFDSGDGTARCPNPAAAPTLCADHQHHPVKQGTRLDGKCRADDLDAECSSKAVSTHLCRMHEHSPLVHEHSLEGVLADEPVILDGPTKKARALRLPVVEAICAHDPEPERLAQLAAVCDALATRGVEMWQMADLGPDDLVFIDTDGAVSVQLTVSNWQFPVLLEDAAWLECRYVTEGATLAEIAAEVGCSAETVRKALVRHGIKARPTRGPRFQRLHDREWVSRRYVTEGATLAEIAAEVGCSAETVRKALVRHGIKARHGNPRRFPLLEDAAWLERRYVTEGATQAEIAAEVGCSAEAVGMALVRHGIKSHRMGPARQFPLLEDAAWLECRYVTEGATLAEIAAEVGCSAETVRKALVRHGIKARHGNPRRFPLLEDAAWLERRYVTEGATQAEIAAEVGCSAEAVGMALVRHGIKSHRMGPARQFPLLEDAAWLECRYVTEGATLAEIAAEVGCSAETVARALVRHGIKVRPAGGAPPQVPLLEDAAWLERRYVTDGATQAEIADEVGGSKHAVGMALVRHGITAPFRTVSLEASGGTDCQVAAIRTVLDNPHHPNPDRPFAHDRRCATALPGPYTAWIEARDSSLLPTGFWLGRRGGELGQAQLTQLSVQEIKGERRVMFEVNPNHSKTGDERELVLPPCTCEAEITTREPMPLTPEMQALIAAQGDDPVGCRLERLVPKIARRPALCVVCSLSRWLAMRWDRPAPAVRCPGDGCGDAAVEWIDGFLRSLDKSDSLHRIWPPLHASSWQTPDHRGALTASGISRIVRRRLERAGLDPSSSHGLKRGAVTEMTQAGMDLAEISEITGNQDLKVLKGYIADDVAEKKRIEAGQRSLGVLWLPDDQDAFIVPDGAITA